MRHKVTWSIVIFSLALAFFSTAAVCYGAPEAVRGGLCFEICWARCKDFPLDHTRTECFDSCKQGECPRKL